VRIARIVINRGEPWEGRARVAEMATGFFADVPDLKLVCDELRCAGDHVVYLWTFTGMRVPVERDHGFRWKMITQSGGT
jgi:hypothetical protein